MEPQSPRDAKLNQEYMRTLDGYLLLLDKDADVMYVSDAVAKILGLNQVRVHFTLVNWLVLLQKKEPSWSLHQDECLY